jgi:diketogulonate reductase-like aldo/keto reductase
MNKPFLSRRQFNALCAAVGLSSLPAGAMALSGMSVLAADAPARTAKLRNSAIVPVIGQGSARLGQGRHPEMAEEEALRTGISLGMNLIDTSGNYGNGRSEKLIGRAIAGQRDRVFLVSKVEANEVSGDGMARACQASLSRLGTNFLDLYLLHWPVPNSQFSDVVAGFEQLRAAGKIEDWGVSNFNVGQMEDLFRIRDGNRCATNQVPYSLNNRGIERDLLTWCRQPDLPVMAYSPLGGENSPLRSKSPTRMRIRLANGRIFFETRSDFTGRSSETSATRFCSGEIAGNWWLGLAGRLTSAPD